MAPEVSHSFCVRNSKNNYAYIRGDGLWNETIQISGTQQSGSLMPEVIHSGWNLVGVASGTDIDRASLDIPDLEAVKDFSSFFIANGNLGNLGVLKSGKAYFIQVK